MGWLIDVLQRLLKLAPGVCRLVVQTNVGEQVGTGFRVGADLLLTNWHVVHNEDDGSLALSARAEFGYEEDAAGVGAAPTAVACDVATVVSDAKEDWAVIRVTQPLDARWVPIPLSLAAEPPQMGGAFVIQHPKGERKRLGFVRNRVTDFNKEVVHYLTDTQDGSSGAPVFDEQGRLIALHREGGRPQEAAGMFPVKKNEGLRADLIAKRLKDKGIAFA